MKGRQILVRDKTPGFVNFKFAWQRDAQRFQNLWEGLKKAGQGICPAFFKEAMVVAVLFGDESYGISVWNHNCSPRR
jgi:hypothetical protein